MFSEDQLVQWRSFPDIGKDELIRFFTLTPADVAFVDPGRGRGPSDRLDLAVALSMLPWLGFVPDDVATAPPVAVARLAERLGVDPAELGGYGRREQTRSDHLRLVAEYLRWKPAPAGSEAMKELEQFLEDRRLGMIELERLAPVTEHFRGQTLRESAGHGRAVERVA